jgi:ankyrin repeat protein
MRMRRVGVAWMLLLVSAAGVSAAGSAPSLTDAIKTGDRNAVRALLKQRVDVNARESDGTTALHWAARADDLETLRLLLRAGADAKAANRYGSTPLELAAVNGDASMIEALLQAGADPNTAMPEGETVLMTAARTGRPDALKVLLTHGADPNAKEAWLGETALMWAVEENHPEAVTLLIKGGADPNVHSLLTKFPKKVRGQTTLPVGSLTALMFGARQGALEATRALVDAGADLNQTDPDGTTALVLAIINSHFDVAGVLLDRGADPNILDSAGMGALYAAVDMHTLSFMHGRPLQKSSDRLNAVDVVQLLLDHKASPNQPLKSVILRRHNTAGNQSLAEGTTPLLRAAKEGDVTLMQLLLKNGADPNLRQKNQNTLLMLAAGYGRRFDQNADALEFEVGTEEDLFRAVKFCVLELGVDVNAVNSVGDSALHWAGADSIRFLVEHGADLNAKNKQGKTPLDVALARKDRTGRQLRQGSVLALRELGAQMTAENADGVPAPKPGEAAAGEQQ